MNLLFAQSEAVIETANEAVETAAQAPAGGGMSFWIMIIAIKSQYQLREIQIHGSKIIDLINFVLQ